ncbi:unnamed protein product, partial [Mesorhabditis spiculigera]
MAAPASFDFLRLNDAQRTAVYHQLGFREKFELRRAAKTGEAVSTTVKIADLDAFPNSLVLFLGYPGQPVKMEYTDHTLPWDASNREYTATKMLESTIAPHDFVNRLTASMPLHEVNFSYNRCQFVELQFPTEYEDAVPIELSTYKQIYEQIAHMERIYVTAGFVDPERWPGVMSILAVFLDAALVKFRPINNAARLTSHHFNFLLYVDEQLDHQLPGPLQEFITTHLGPHDRVEIDRESSVTQGSYTGGRTRLDQWRLVLVENRARWTAEMRRDRFWPTGDEREWIREWSAHGR